MRSVIRGAMAAAIGIFATFGSVEAAVYRGTFDPPGPLFDYSGTFMVDIPDACVALPGPITIFYPANCPGPPAPVLTALHVDITLVATNAPFASFDYPALPYVLNSFLVQNFDAVGINTGFLAIGSAGGYNFFIQFFTSPTPGNGLWTGVCGVVSGGGADSECIPQGTSDRFTMTRVVAVPEPAIWMLMLIALAGAAMTLRRRQLNN